MYLPSILETYCTTEVQVRLSATQTILLILRQGLVHPGQCVPHLITLSTDSEQQIRLKAEQQLTEYSSRFGGFMQVKRDHLILHCMVFTNRLIHVLVHMYILNNKLLQSTNNL